MSLHRVFLLLFSLLAFAVPVQAEIFKYYDSNGNLVLTDAPPKDKAAKAEKIEAKPVMTIPALKGIPKVGDEAAKAKGKAINYTIVIQSPVNDATFRRADAETIPVNVSVTPALASGHSQEFLLDGTRLADAGSISLDGIERGNHQLLVNVLDADGKVVTSASATFHVQAYSILGPTAPKPKPKP